MVMQNELNEIRKAMVGVGEVTAEAAKELVKIREQIEELISKQDERNKELASLSMQAKLLGHKASAPIDKLAAKKLEETTGQLIEENNAQKKAMKGVEKEIEKVVEETPIQKRPRPR